MKKQILLIDYENIQDFDLSQLRDTALEMKIFVGQTQNKIPFEVVRVSQKLGKTVEWVKIDGVGRNALDFHIAFYLGRLSQEDNTTSFVILSRDAGFDPLIRHLNDQQIACRRVSHLQELSRGNELPALNDEQIARVMENLSKIGKNQRPRTRKRLHQYIKSLFQKKIDDLGIDRAIDALFARKMLSEENRRLTYKF